jgi:hypothetical protein
MAWTKNVEKAFELINEMGKSGALDAEQVDFQLIGLQAGDKQTIDNFFDVEDQWELVYRSFNRDLEYLARQNSVLIPDE